MWTKAQPPKQRNSLGNSADWQEIVNTIILKEDMEHGKNHSGN